MRTFAQKTKATQQTMSAKFTIPSRPYFAQSREANSIFHLQRAIGNQAVLRLLAVNSGDGKRDDLSATNIAHFGHDVTRIPVHATTPQHARSTALLRGMEELVRHESFPLIRPRHILPLGEHHLKSHAVISGGDANERKVDRIADGILAGQCNGPITLRSQVVARMPDGDSTNAQTSQASQQPYMGFTPALGDVATQPVEPINTVGVVDVPITSLFSRQPPHAPIATVTSGTLLTVKGIIRPSDTSKQPVYVVLYHGRMAMKQSEQKEMLVPLFDLAVSSRGPMVAKLSAAQMANDWMTVVPETGQRGDAEAQKPALRSIRDARAAIEERKLSYVKKKKPNQPREGYKSEVDDKTRDYDKWLRNKDTHPRLAKSAGDIRWNVLRRFFAAEGRPSEMMTYDFTNITWGPGFAGMGASGITEQAMARLFNQSEEAKDAFWKVGITVVGADLVMVNIKDAEKGIGEKLHGTRAENELRLDKKLLSFFINVSQGLTEPGQIDPSESLRQDVLDAQFETFLNTTLSGSEGIIEGMEEMAAAVAAHAVHTGNHGWGEFRGATSLSAVEGRINAQIANLKKQKEQGKKVGYIVPLDHIKRNLDRKFIDEA